MSDTTADISALHDFQVDAHVLLTRAQECLSHLDLIGHDTDACDCLLNTLGTLAERAHLQTQTQIADFCRQLCHVLEPQQCRARLHAALPKLKACLSLLAWQLELIDPHTGQLNLDPRSNWPCWRNWNRPSGSCTQNRPRRPPHPPPLHRPGRMKLHN
ncbi:histidine kinase [Pseudomonas qingdaonensis]|nr:histidine kinase [Pseudomonas qingdaonensis]